jgi:hypothetical protein
MELMAPFQVDKILGIGEGTVEGTGDTDSLLLDYNHLDSLQDRGYYCLAPQSGAQVQIVLAVQEVDIHLQALGKSPTSLECVLRVCEPAKT